MAANINEKGAFGPVVTKLSMLAMQVCVPSEWTNYMAKDFAEAQYPCGTEHGWHVREQGDPMLNGDDERVPCRERTGYVHIMLDA